MNNIITNDFVYPQEGITVTQQKRERISPMPIISCDIRNGRTKEQKHQLAMQLTRAIAEATGVNIDNIFVVMREMPGFNFVDAGEHVPDYVPGPDGVDLAGHEQIKNRKERTQHS